MLARSALSLAMLVVFNVGSALDAHGSPLVLSTSPAGTASRQPAPNVIVSVDDSRSMDVSGMATLRSALKDTFSAANLPDGSIRLAWQAMTSCYTIPAGDDCKNQNALRVLDAVQRGRFQQWVDTLVPQGATPSHRMIFNAGQYLKSAPGVDSPWASVPGTTQEPMLSCRKAYNLFMTDGGWNSTTSWDAADSAAARSIGNRDGTTGTLGDRTTAYDVASDSTAVYRDRFGTSALPTLSDLAFHFWATDLQPSLANDVPAKIAHKGDQTFTSDGSSRTISEFWNPRNDPATWQHMTTYTVGFNAAANWNGTSATPKFGTDTWTGGDYAALMTGRTRWTDAIDGDETTRMPELWHMALNGRGKFVPAPTASSLGVAFKDILDSIAADKSSPVSSVSVSANSTRLDAAVFTSSYDPAGWSGAITAHKLAAGTGVASPDGLWGTVPATATSVAKPVSTATLMDDTAFSPHVRVVMSARRPPAAGDSSAVNGISFVWSALATAQQRALDTSNATVDGLGKERLAFVRGFRDDEQSNGGNFRNRDSRHGDVVNSRPWYVASKASAGYSANGYAAFRAASSSRSSMLYVGANDGMLHGFSVADGKERLAYVPMAAYAGLSELTQPGYAHRYFVDGSPLAGDLYVGGGWKTYLAGFMGAGGKGYFVLDVTDPSAFVAGNAGNIVVLDQTAAAGTSADADMGYIFSEPVREQGDTAVTRQITQLNDGRWALVTGNGYNSTRENAVLMIQYLDGARELRKIHATSESGLTGNGLSAPRLVDLNGDNVPDVAYAGDLLGNLWKFDLSATAPSEWKTAFNGAPLYSAGSAATAGVPGRPQAITSAPVWLPHPRGGVMVVFGTGANLTDADRTDTSVQTVYGVYDNAAVTRSAGKLVLTGGSALTGGRSLLVQQTIGSIAAAVATSASGSASPLWAVSSNPVDYAGSPAKRGWYLDLPAGERVLGNLTWFDGQLVDVASTVPAAGADITRETCSPTITGARNFLTTINAINGSAPKSDIYAYVGAAGASNATHVASRSETGVRSSVRDSATNTEKAVCAAGQICTDRKLLGRTALRPSWRQMQ
ncbi:type 4a pilus biogenesis protein PilY1 [soil metagenome]